MAAPLALLVHRTYSRATLNCVRIPDEKQNITLALPKRVLRRLKVIAAQRDTSVSALLLNLLKDFVSREDAYEEAKREELKLMERGILDVGKITWTRDDVHQR